MNRDELLDNLADRMVRLATAIEQDRDAKLRLRQEFSECREIWEQLQRESTHETKLVGERLAKIEIVLGIVERETTGAHHKLPPVDEGQVVGALKAFGALPPRAQWLLILGAPFLALFGWCVHELFFK